MGTGTGIKKKLKDFGEFGLIEKIKKDLGRQAGIILGIGDDAAVLPGDSKKDILFTTDMLIEERHFCLSDATPYEIGWKALAVNVSDIAAMGGTPTQAVIAVGLPADLPADFAKELYRGIKTLARRFKISIAGGDTNASEKLVISIALLGEVKKNGWVPRSGARVGDVIFVTGFLGDSYGTKKHLRFIPRIDEAQFLTKNFKIHAMMDISDGLASDIHRLAHASGVGARIAEDSVPMTSPKLGVHRALTDGEDFELLFTCSTKEATRLSLDSHIKNFEPFHAIGKIVKRSQGIRLIKCNGSSRPILEHGFDHFNSQC